MADTDNVPQRQSVPEMVSSRNSTFKYWQRIWYAVHYLSGLIAVIAGGLATAAVAITTDPNTVSYPAYSAFIEQVPWIWGLIASLFSGIVTFLGPLRKAESYKHAYYRLSTAITRYEESLIEKVQLLEEFETAQNTVLIGDPSAYKARDRTQIN
ncbi:hypothetical protein [Nitrosomonas sp.]|uniref:hypothetical protein n=1 Tax=Nitrosomonas sp. TaxID=42353 RepID=UPI0025EA60FB|nr:hypothetical protein [Nitrosomonas sp.]